MTLFIIILAFTVMVYMTPDGRYLLRKYLTALEVQPHHKRRTRRIKRCRWHTGTQVAVAKDWNPQVDDLALWMPVMVKNYGKY